MTRSIGSATDTRADVEEDGDLVLESAEAINFGPNVTATDDGDGTVTVSAEEPLRSVSIPMTDLADTDFITVRVKVPPGKTLEVLEAGVQTDTNTVPGGLTLEVDTESGGSVDSNEVSANADHTSGDPLGSVAGGKTAAFRVENDTGGPVGAGGFAEYQVV